jgi:hypothetical protein
MIGEYPSQFLKIVNLASMLTGIALGKIAPPIGLGVELLSGMAFASRVFRA